MEQKTTTTNPGRERGARRPAPARLRAAAGVLLPLACVGLLSLGARSSGEGEGIEDTRAALEQWVETRRILSKERSDWKIGKEMLTERIELMQREIAARREAIREAEENIAEADKKRVELIEENEGLKVASSSLAERVKLLEERTKELLGRLPDPIRERVKPLSQRFPKDPDDTKLSLSERFQNIVGVLNEVNKFNREITVTSEVHELAGGTRAEVTALYVGIGQSYYVNGTGTAAGVGRATEEGWAWEPANGAAAAIEEAVSILGGEKPAAYVQLPVRIE